MLPLLLSLFILLVEGQEQCSRPADIAFLIDDSRSIWIVDFKKVLEFVKTLVNQFDISENTTRIAAVSFSSDAKQQFSLTDYNSAAQINEAVGAISHRYGWTTDTQTGIQFVRENIFRLSRPGVPRIMIIITDGVSTKRADTIAQATETINSGITIIVIGVGRMDTVQLAEMASKPTDKYLFTVDSFPELARIESLVAQQACEGHLAYDREDCRRVIIEASIPHQDQPDPEKECQGKPVDVVFVLDVSSSVYILDFNKQIAFVMDVIDIFDIGPDKTHVATVSFSTNATVEYYLNEFDNKQDIKDRTAKTIYTGGNTETRLALALVRDEVLTAKRGARDGVPHIVITITDGLSQEYLQTRAVAKTLKDSGAHMFAIGVGPNIDKQELKDIGSEPSEKYVFEVDGYGALDTIKEIIAFRTCQQTP